MTEREKIAQIIAEHLCSQGKSHKRLYGSERRCYSRDNFAECEKVSKCVDALIAAGIGDVLEEKSKAFVYANEIAYLDNQLKEYKHCAEVAERALREFAVQVGCRSCPYKGRCDISNPSAENDYQECYEVALRIAEKELTEGRKDEN